MANVKTLVGQKILVQIGDGGSPEVFTHPCLINAERGVQMGSEVNESTIIDCDNPDNPGWKQVFKDGLSIQVSGGGNLDTSFLEEYFNWQKSDTAKNVRIKFDVAGALGGGYIAGQMKLTQFNIAGVRQNNATADVSLMSHGEMAWTDNA